MFDDTVGTLDEQTAAADAFHDTVADGKPVGLSVEILQNHVIGHAFKAVGKGNHAIVCIGYGGRIADPRIIQRQNTDAVADNNSGSMVKRLVSASYEEVII